LRRRDVSSLRHVAHGGAPIATETLRRAHETFPWAELLHIYGATETSPIATLLPHEERLLDAPQSRSCGQPAVGVDVAMLDLDGRQVSRRDRRTRRPRPERDGALLEQAEQTATPRRRRAPSIRRQG
jgi:acyl-coenzyme A synthetase/AMP-(fatty) acid ligase